MSALLALANDKLCSIQQLINWWDETASGYNQLELLMQLLQSAPAVLPPHKDKSVQVTCAHTLPKHVSTCVYASDDHSLSMSDSSTVQRMSCFEK
jgi:hypothetical protein